MLVTSAGNPILDENNDPININGQAKGYSVTENGSLVVEMTGGEQQTVNLGVTLVNNPQFLVSKGDNLLGLPDNLGTLNVVEGDVLTNLEGVLRDQISIKQGALGRFQCGFIERNDRSDHGSTLIPISIPFD